MKSKFSFFIVSLISLCCISAFVGLIGGSLPVFQGLDTRLEGSIVCPQGTLTITHYDNGNNYYSSFWCSVNGKLQDASIQFTFMTTLIWGTPIFLVLLIAFVIFLGIRRITAARQ